MWSHEASNVPVSSALLSKLMRTLRSRIPSSDPCAVCQLVLLWWVSTLTVNDSPVCQIA